MAIEIPLYVSASMSTAVDKALLADEIGSGSVRVLATPMMIALMEAAALEAVREYLPENHTTVGTRVDVEHIKATPAGETIHARAELLSQEGERLRFSVEARDGRGLIGQGTHERRIVDKEKFMKTAHSGGG